MARQVKRGAKEKLNVEELMQYMLKLFNDTSNELHEEYEKLSQKDMELSDLDHYIEIHSLKSYELARVGRLRKNIKRRTQRNKKQHRDDRDNKEIYR